MNVKPFILQGVCSALAILGGVFAYQLANKEIFINALIASVILTITIQVFKESNNFKLIISVVSLLAALVFAKDAWTIYQSGIDLAQPDNLTKVLFPGILSFTCLEIIFLEFFLKIPPETDETKADINNPIR